MVSAMILFAGMVNQHVRYSQVAPSTEELMVELLKRTTKDVTKLTEEVQNIASRSDGARLDAVSIQTEGSGPGVQPDSGQSL